MRTKTTFLPLSTNIRTTPLPRQDMDRDVVFLGKTQGGRSLCLRVDELFKHVWIRGMPGSGKSALIGGLNHQLIDIIGDSRNLSLVIIDLKGDTGLFWAVSQQCCDLGVPLKILNPVPGEASHPYNPILQPFFMQLPPLTRAELMGEALAVVYGQEYGKSYFGSFHEMALRLALGQYLRNFGELETAVLNSPIDGNMLRHLANQLHKMKTVEFMNVSDPDRLRNQVDIGSLFDRAQVVYCSLPAILFPDTAYTIARCIMGNLLLAARLRPPGTRNGIIFVCDEAGKIVNRAMDTFLDQSRQLQIGGIYAHQHSGQLRTSLKDHLPDFQACMNVRIDYTPHIHAAEHLAYPPKYFEYVPSFSCGMSESYTSSSEGSSETVGFSRSQTWSPKERPIYNEFDLNMMSYYPNMFLFHAIQQTAPYGFGGIPMIGKSYYHVDKHTYLRREATPFPTQQLDCFEPGMATNSQLMPGVGLPAPVAETGVADTAQPLLIPPTDSELWNELSETAKAHSRRLQF